MNLKLFFRRLRTVDVRQMGKALLPTPINVLLYMGREPSKLCPHHLPSSIAINSFSMGNLSNVDRIDKRLTSYNLAYVGSYSGKIVHESWVSFDTLLPSQFGFDSRFPVIGYSHTLPTYRGRSIYPCVLNYILHDLRNRNISNNAYILVSPENKASIRGIEKAGFELVAHLKGLRIVGSYIINKSTTVRSESLA
jgi:hypothetical protein